MFYKYVNLYINILYTCIKYLINILSKFTKYIYNRSIRYIIINTYMYWRENA